MRVNTTQQNIPSGWQEKSLGKFLTISKGKLPRKTYGVSDVDLVPYLSIKHLDGGEFKYAHKSDGVIADKDDLLVIADGSGSGRMYRGYYGLVSSTFLKISSESPSEISNDYLEVLFSHLDFTKSRFRKGGAIPHFDFKQLKDVDILLPPIKEQQKIVEILGTVDEDIAKTQEVIEATEKLKRGLMQQLFIRGIGHTKFKETKIGQIPEEWDVVKLGDYIDFKNGFAFSSGNYSETGKIVIRMSNISTDGTLNVNNSNIKFIPDHIFDDLSDFTLRKGDLIMSMTDVTKDLAIVGRTSVIDKDNAYILNQRVGRIRTLEGLDYKFLHHLTNSDFYLNKIHEKVTGSAQYNLSTEHIKRSLIVLPQISEQKEIAEILSAVDEKISVNKKLKEKLVLLKKGLMQDLLSGKVRTI